MTPIVRNFFHIASSTWTHVVIDAATKRAAIVDPVLDFDIASGSLSTESIARVLEYVGTAGVTLDWILETHAHADHVSAGAWLRAKLGAKLGIGAGIADVQRRFAQMLDLDDSIGDAPFDRLFADGDTFSLGALTALVIATPGHTSDGVSYVIGDAVFVGDTLFAPNGGTGRCDFPGGDAAASFRSIGKLYELPDAMRVFLCHDYPPSGSEPRAETTIGEQKRANVHLCATTSEGDFVKLRQARDATLAVPKLLWPAIQLNIRGGGLPPGAPGGVAFLKIPVRFDPLS